MNREITIIGAGKMGLSLAEGLVRKGFVKRDNLILTNSKTHNNKEAAEKADVVIFAVKPQIMKGVLQEVSEVKDGSLAMSMAAGVTLDSISRELSGGEKTEIVRVMSNLAAQVEEGMSVWTVNRNVTEENKKVTQEVLGSVGKECEVDNEDMIDKATAISGSGPAYFFYIVELLTEMGMQFGFSEEISRLLAEQTFIGAAKVLAEAHQDAATLRRAVTSKGGTTEAAFKQFEREHLDKRFMKGVDRAYRRAKELGKM